MNKIVEACLDGFRDCIRLWAALILALISAPASVIRAFVSRTGEFGSRTRDADSR